MGDVADILTIAVLNGAIFALIALGLALVFKATKVLNFAHGEIATSSAFVALLVMRGLDSAGVMRSAEAVEGRIGPFSSAQLLIAVVPAMIAGALLSVLVKVILDRMKDATPATQLVLTIGLAVFMVGVQIKGFGVEGDRFPQFVDGPAFTLPGANIPMDWHTIITVVVLGVTAALLALYFKTPYGVALLATSQDPFAAELQGVNTKAITTSAWAVAGAMAGAAGLLAAGIFELLGPGLVLRQFLIPAFAAALLGGITSMVGAVVGGLLLGLVVATANQLNQAFNWGLPGTPQIAVLLALLLVLLLRPRGLLGREA